MAIDEAFSPGPGVADGSPRRTGRLTVSGAQIHYEVSGQGPVIVFAHGLGGNHMSWWQQVAHFASRYTCVTFAHRGFAPSSVDGGQPDPLLYADDLSALIDHLQLGKVHLVGQSMGGWTMVEYCLRHPGRVSSLVLSATTGSIDPMRSAGVDQAALEAWKRDAPTTVARCRNDGVHPAAGPRMAKEQPALHLLYQQIDELSRGLDKEVLRGRLQAMRVRPVSDLAATQVPLLLVSPQEDLVIPPPALRALAAGVSGARLVPIAQAGHSPYFERASDFNRSLDEFFNHLGRDRHDE